MGLKIGLGMMPGRCGQQSGISAFLSKGRAGQPWCHFGPCLLRVPQGGPALAPQELSQLLDRGQAGPVVFGRPGPVLGVGVSLRGWQQCQLGCGT